MLVHPGDFKQAFELGRTVLFSCSSCRGPTRRSLCRCFGATGLISIRDTFVSDVCEMSGTKTRVLEPLLFSEHVIFLTHDSRTTLDVSPPLSPFQTMG